MTPTISIVMPLFNKEKEVLRSLSSVFSQTISDFELIVINDGSTDKGAAVVSGYTDSRIRLFEQVNSGVSAARNRGIAEARSDIIAFLDADDEWLPDFLETILRLRTKFPKCKVYATRYIMRYRNGASRTAIVKGLADGFLEGVLQDYFVVATQSDPPLCSSAIAVCKKAIIEIGGFPININAGEDLLTWARLATTYEIAYCFYPLVKYYVPQYGIIDQPPRLPQIPDLVSKGLKDIADNVSLHYLRDLNAYLALWHRMRAVAFIRSNMIAETMNEINLSVRYGGMSARLFMLRSLCCLPGKLPARVFKSTNEILQMHRSHSENCKNKT
jgi:glycosyltransferase involved in cell wall biosynthesis